MDHSSSGYHASGNVHKTGGTPSSRRTSSTTLPTTCTICGAPLPEQSGAGVFGPRCSAECEQRAELAARMERAADATSRWAAELLDEDEAGGAKA
jgi:uncharacterized Zn finger protein (UPF0148 family)